MKNKKKVAVFSGNRAEFGLLSPIIRAIDNSKNLEGKLIVAGAHLDSNFGGTISEIREDGFKIDAQVAIDIDPTDGSSGTSIAIGNAVVSISKILASLNPDFLIVYADRFEGFAAAIAASQMNIPLIHMEGGDLTEGGALDDSVRHAITKLAHIHFTTNEQATSRILAMGEEPWRVNTAGLPAIDFICSGNYASECEIVKELGLEKSAPVIIFTQHSVTTEPEMAAKQVSESISALSNCVERGFQIVITYPNNDLGAKEIINAIERFSLFHADKGKVLLVKSLGRYKYHGLIALAKNPEWKIICMGNSSSGIKETAIFNCPTVNIGTRQSGRLQANNVLNVDYDCNQILAAIDSCINDVEFLEKCATCSNPYGSGGAGKYIASYLENLPYDKRLILRKKMTLL
jgi:UDP-N-acetylglucosamine 2-epimerase (non-hydrolysing)/GDP/UDP-N,N'-diacetylbacillosamine 2-epimerase (hydrolysing)